ncbi:MAG: 7TM-DISM domain-containing protein [Bacteroidota bacterium]
MKGISTPIFYPIILAIVLVTLPFSYCQSIPILRFSPHNAVSNKNLAEHLWVLVDANPKDNLSAIKAKEDQFKPFLEVKDQLDPAATHWAILRIHNDSPDPVEYLLRESNESQMQVFIVEGSRLIYSGQSGQFVKLSEEQLPEGSSWEARVHLKLQPGQYQQIYLRVEHALHITQPFDLALEPYSEYQKNIRIRNLIQPLFQGALGILLLFHILLFAVKHRG